MFDIPTEHQDWAHIYLLHYWDAEGRHQLTTFSADESTQWVHAIVYGASAVPLWKARVPEGATFDLIPADAPDPRALARERGGLYAVGWYIPEGFERR